MRWKKKNNWRNEIDKKRIREIKGRHIKVHELSYKINCTSWAFWSLDTIAPFHSFILFSAVVFYTLPFNFFILVLCVLWLCVFVWTSSFILYMISCTHTWMWWYELERVESLEFLERSSLTLMLTVVQVPIKINCFKTYNLKINFFNLYHQKNSKHMSSSS